MSHQRTRHAAFRRGITTLPIILLANPVLAAERKEDTVIVTADEASPATPSTSEGSDAITVNGRRAPEIEAARKKLDKIPGGASVIDADVVERGKAATVSDVLALQPGVFVQQVGGNDAIKVSVRGSGINSSPGNMTEGIKWLFDGVGFTGPGGSSYELFEPLGIAYTEVLRGANAFDYGAVTLGGAINFVSRTGLTDPGITAGIQGGSYGYVKGNLAWGGQHGKLDWYLSGVYSSADGYQQQTSHHKAALNGNVGIKVTDNLDTRFFLRLADEQHYQAGLLTLAQFYANPRQNSAANLAAKSDVRKFLSYSFANRTDWSLGDKDKLSFGVNLSSTPQHINTRSTSPSDSRYTDLNLSLHYTHTGQLLGRPDELSAGWFYALNVDGYTVAYSPTTGAVTKRNRLTGSYDNVFTLSNSLEVVDGLKLLSGFSLVNIHRQPSIVSISIPIKSGQAGAVDYSDWTAAPRFGISYAPIKALELFANYSQSVNPVASWGYSPSTASFNYVKPLVNQDGFTYEVGARIKLDRLDGSVNFYRSAVHHEFLTIVVPAGVLDTLPVTTGFNSSPTLHQGVEAALNSTLWRGRQGSLRLRQSYTYSDLHFRNDATYGAAQLPGVPPHLYQAELLFDEPHGFYGGATVRVSSSTFVDYANTLKAPAYTVVGLKAGWRPTGGRWSVFVDVQNLADRKYVTAIGPVGNANGLDAAAFYPGDGRSVTGGLTVHF